MPTTMATTTFENIYRHAAYSTMIYNPVIFKKILANHTIKYFTD